MADKILNTRLRLKYDTLANWSAANPVLLEGEVGVVSVPVASETTVGQVVKPAILFKVGDGTTDFNTLPWASGMAADVHAWAKNDTGHAEDIKVFDETNAFIGKTITEALAQLNTEIGALTGGGESGSISQMINDAINALDVTDTAVEGQYVSAITQTDGKIEVIRAALPDYSNIYASKSIEDEVADIKADYLKSTDKAELMAAIDAIEEYDDTEVRGLITAETTRATEAEEALDVRIDALEAYDHITYATKSEVEAVASDLADANTKLDAEIEARIAADETHTANIKTNTDAIAVLNGNTSVEGSVDKKVTDAINAFATQISDDETVNTYKELIDYAASHGSEFTELVGEVDANTKSIQTLNGDVNTAGSVDKKIADAISAAAADATTKANAAETNAKAYADSLAVNYATAAQGAKADTAIQEITTTADNGLKVSKTGTAVNIDLDDTVTFILYGGTATKLV